MPPPPPTMMMMPPSQQQPQQMMYQSPVSSYMYSAPHRAMQYGYRPMMQQGRMIPSGMPMPMMAAGSTFATPPRGFPHQQSFFNPLAQQLVY